MDEITLLIYAITISSSICIAAFTAYIAYKKAIKKLSLQLKRQEAELMNVNQQYAMDINIKLKSLIKADHHFAKQLQLTNTDIQNLRARLDRIESSLDINRAYNQAKKLVERGAHVEELVDACGLTSAEAALLSNLQSYKQQAGCE